MLISKDVMAAVQTSVPLFPDPLQTSVTTCRILSGSTSRATRAGFPPSASLKTRCLGHVDLDLTCVISLPPRGCLDPMTRGTAVAHLAPNVCGRGQYQSLSVGSMDFADEHVRLQSSRTAPSILMDCRCSRTYPTWHSYVGISRGVIVSCAAGPS